MVQAIKDQADVLCMVAPPFANDQRSEAARLIVEKANRDGAGGHFEKVFFTNAGAEAVENAVRLAKGYTGRMKVLSTYRSYHGGTALTVGLTGEPRRLENEPSVPGSSSSGGRTRTGRRSTRRRRRRRPSGRSRTCATRS